MTDTTCQLLDEYLDDYLDDGLTEGDRERYERHLAACAKCREAVRRQRELDGALRAYAATLESKPRVPAPIDAAAAIGRKSAWRRSSTAAAIRLVAVASSVIAVAMLSMLAAEKKLERGQGVKAPDGGGGETLQAATANAAANSTGSNAAKGADLAPQVLAIDAPDFLAIVEPPRGDELTFVMLYPTSKSSE